MIPITNTQFAARISCRHAKPKPVDENYRCGNMRHTVDCVYTEIWTAGDWCNYLMPAIVTGRSQ